MCLQGWVEAEREGELAKVLEKYDCAWETAEPAEDEYPEVPVRLKNNRFTRALNMVTEMYSLPAYNNVDPNPLMAPFFILFYGIMLADMGLRHTHGDSGGGVPGQGQAPQGHAQLL